MKPSAAPDATSVVVRKLGRSAVGTSWPNVHEPARAADPGDAAS
jgi:hypothetical protein